VIAKATGDSKYCSDMTTQAHICGVRIKSIRLTTIFAII